MAVVRGDVTEPIFSMTALQRTPSEVKAAARDSVVRITEQGAAAYVFCSEEAFARRIEVERAEAAFETRLEEAVGRSLADIEEGRYVTSVYEALSRAERLRGGCVAGGAACQPATPFLSLSLGCVKHL